MGNDCCTDDSNQSMIVTHSAALQNTDDLCETKDTDIPSQLIEFFRFSTTAKVSEILNQGIMSDFTEWNIFKLYEVCGHHTLLICSDHLFLKLNLYQTLNISRNKLLIFLKEIELGYLDIPYHNHLHGTDVMINTYHFLIKSNLIISDLDRMIVLLSAACHDYKHPGLNSSFLIETNHEIAIKYKDESPLLETMHSNEVLELLANSKYNGFMEHFSKEEIQYITQNMRDIIIGTAPEKHKEHIDKLSFLIENKASDNEMNIIKHHKKDIMVIALHCADIGVVCKSYDLFCKWWIINIFTEWFMQNDKEKELKLSKTWKMMDRDNIDKIAEWLYLFIESLFVPLHHKWSSVFYTKKEFRIWYKQLLENNTKLKTEDFRTYFK